MKTKYFQKCTSWYFSFHERGGSIYHPWYSTTCDLNKTIQIVIYEASKIPHNACICYVFRIYLNTQSRNLHRLTISVSFMKTLIVKKQDFFKSLTLSVMTSFFTTITTVYFKIPDAPFPYPIICYS